MSLRHIKPELVAFIDAHLPPGGNTPNQLLERALLACKGVHEEGGNNKGKIVELFQSTVGGPVGQPWCGCFQQSCIAYVEHKLGVTCPIPPTEGCQYVTDWAKKHGLYHSTPAAGDLIVWQHGNTSNGHIGYVLKTGDMLETIEGNTGAASGQVEREGDVVAVKLRSPKGTGDMKIVGYVPVTFSAPQHPVAGK